MTLIGFVSFADQNHAPGLSDVRLELQGGFSISEDIALADLRLYPGISYESGTGEREASGFVCAIDT